MKLKIKHGAAALFFVSVSGFSNLTTTHWDYHGENGPEHWGSITQDFNLCSKGKNQSPVNIQKAIRTQLSNLDLSFKSGTQSIVNNGHAIQINVEKGNTLTLDGKTYSLTQFHFHTPSENEINGVHFPLEMHLVYQTDAGDLAVVALLFKEGETNKALENAWKHLPENVGDKAVLSHPVDLKALLPDTLNHFRFSGSLTTPPCSEGVVWLVLEKQVDISPAQISAFKKVISENNRPVQPLNGRQIVDE